MVTVKKETPSKGSESALIQAQLTPAPPPAQYTFQHQFQLNPVSRDYQQQDYQQQDYQMQLKLLEEQNAKRLRMARAKEQASAATYQQEIKMESQNASPMPPQVFTAGGSFAFTGSSVSASSSSRLQPSGGHTDGLPHREHPLQKYQMQLMLLGKQNKKRSHMALQGRETLQKASSSQTASSILMNHADDDIHARLMASGDHAAARDYTMQLELLKKQILKSKASKKAGSPRHGATSADFEMQLKMLDDEIQKNRDAEALQNPNASGFDKAFTPCPAKMASLRDSGNHQAAQDYETQLLLLKQQVQKRNRMQAMERQKGGNSKTLGNESQAMPKGRNIVRDAKDLMCIKAELAFTRNCIIRFHQNRQAILALEEHHTTLDRSQILETQDGSHSSLTQQMREVEDEIIKNHFISRGSEPPNDLFELCPEKWDEDHHAMEKLMDSFQSLWDNSWEDEKFQKGEDMLYSIKDCIHSYFYPEDLHLHPPMKPIQRLGQEVGKKMAKFITTQVILEQEEEMTVLEFCQRYYVPGASPLDDRIIRGLDNAGVLARKREWLKQQVKKQIEEREKGRKDHFCRRGGKKIDDGDLVWSREGTVDSRCSRMEYPLEGTREDTPDSGWSSIGSPTGSTWEGTVDSEWSRLDTPTGSTREGTIDSEWSRVDTPMEGMEGNETEGEGFQHVLPIRSVNMTG